MKLNISIDFNDVLKKPVIEWDDKDEQAIDTKQESQPRKDKEVVLPMAEASVDQLPNAEPVEHLVKKGETLKQICEKYGVSYGEMSNHLMATEGTTSIFEGQKIEIPRHFIDLTRAA